MADRTTENPGLLTEIFATPPDWFIKARDLEPWGIMRIAPVGNLDAVEMLKALIRNYGNRKWTIRHHGTVIFVQPKTARTTQGES